MAMLTRGDDHFLAAFPEQIHALDHRVLDPEQPPKYLATRTPYSAPWFLTLDKPET